MESTENRPVTQVSHTPGPWHVEMDGPRMYVSSLMGSIVQIPRPYDDESDGNAHLIAAAPTMEAALIEAESALAVRASLRDGEQARNQKALEAVRAALKEAGVR